MGLDLHYFVVVPLELIALFFLLKIGARGLVWLFTGEDPHERRSQVGTLPSVTFAGSRIHPQKISRRLARREGGGSPGLRLYTGCRTEPRRLGSRR